jgi:hypothetical protein
MVIPVDTDYLGALFQATHVPSDSTTMKERIAAIARLHPYAPGPEDRTTPWY